MPAVASKNAYSRPLIVWVVVAIWTPSRFSVVSAPTEEVVGTIPRSPLAPAAWLTLKLSLLPLQEIPSKEDWLRPSSHCSICWAETTGTPRDCAEATIASEPALEALSVCMFAVKTP